MRETEPTTREQIEHEIRSAPATPSSLAASFDVGPATVLDHVSHIARSLDGTDEQLLVAPPECRECGFDGFDDLVNRPSRCPECRHESIAEPEFTIA